jgi:hypothetical protein
LNPHRLQPTFRLDPEHTFGDNPLLERQAKGVSIEYAALPVDNVLFLCLYETAKGCTVVRSETGQRSPLWIGSYPCRPSVLSTQLGLLDKYDYWTMDHQFMLREILDGECFHLLARNQAEGEARHVYLDSPESNTSRSARCLARKLGQLLRRPSHWFDPGAATPTLLGWLLGWLGKASRQ